MNKFREILDESLRAASSGEIDEALRQLSKGVKDASRQGEQRWLVLLAKNAGLLFERKGKLNQARTFYRTALQCNKSDPYLHLSLAQICTKLGQKTAARRHFDACYELAAEQNEHDLLKLLKQYRRNTELAA